MEISCVATPAGERCGRARPRLDLRQATVEQRAAPARATRAGGMLQQAGLGLVEAPVAEAAGQALRRGRAPARRRGRGGRDRWDP